MSELTAAARWYKSLLGLLQVLGVIFGMTASIYVFHKQVLLQDLQAYMYTKTEGVELEEDMSGLKKQIREDIRDIRAAVFENRKLLLSIKIGQGN